MYFFLVGWLKGRSYSFCFGLFYGFKWRRFLGLVSNGCALLPIDPCAGSLKDGFYFFVFHSYAVIGLYGICSYPVDGWANGSAALHFGE